MSRPSNMALQRTRRPRYRSGRSLRSLGSPLSFWSLGPRRLSRSLVFVLAINLGSFLLSSAASACSCAEPPTSLQNLVKRAKQQSSHVFLALATDVLDEGPDRAVIFRVERSWKPGSAPLQVEVRTAAAAEACGYRFEVGKRYLVYGRTEAGVLRTDICTRTKEAAAAKDDLRILGAGKSPKKSLA